MGNSTAKPQSYGEFKKLYASQLMSDHGQQTYDAGICHGMCLDWMRSMLRGDMKFKTSSLEERAKMLKMQDSIHKTFQATIGEIPGALKDTLERYRAIEGPVKAARETHKEDVDTFNALALVLGSGYVDPGDRDNLELVVMQQRDRVLQQRKIFRTERALHDRAMALSRIAKNSKKNFHHTFQYFSQRYAELRGGEDDFAGIVATPHDEVTPKIPAQLLIGIRAQLHALRSAQCALLDYRRMGGGHFVAFYREGSTYHFFDPNVGWYAANGEDKIWEIFENLFNIVYASKNYTTSMWTVFERR